MIDGGNTEENGGGYQSDMMRSLRMLVGSSAVTIKTNKPGGEDAAEFGGNGA